MSFIKKKIKSIKRSEVDLAYLFRYGLPKRKLNKSLERNILDQFDNPVFFLSTGRCGTTWFAHLMKKSKDIISFHEPEPNLAYQSKYLYRLFSENSEISYENKLRIAFEIFLAARGKDLRYLYKAEKRFVETNNRLSFFLPAIFKYMPNAKFIHLYRHPGEFVRSGMRRDYYFSKDIIRDTRIAPFETHSDHKNWEKFDQIQKISWLWNETNSFIETFKQEKKSARILSFDFNSKNVDNVKELFDFMKINVNPEKVKKSLDIRMNDQKEGKFPLYQNWQEEDKTKLRVICGDLSKQYNYKL